ncbi:hypothetical protein [Sorangium cellulosum]|uniref:hypothetical protein n=1 Tax=Sorangium cellulosum TaxID=56 RepID=UPI0003144738|nr:hypothetical protein [Sorangium cellulosum]
MITERAPIWLGFAAATELFVELDPARVRYDLALERGTEAVLARYRFRPGVLLGVEL